jgi:hypothetical protein
MLPTKLFFVKKGAEDVDKLCEICHKPLDVEEILDDNQYGLCFLCQAEAAFEGKALGMEYA